MEAQFEEQAKAARVEMFALTFGKPPQPSTKKVEDEPDLDYDDKPKREGQEPEQSSESIAAQIETRAKANKMYVEAKDALLKKRITGGPS